MKILVLSNSEWDDGNSFGSTFSNILSFESSNHIANIYCRNGTPYTTTCGHFLSMGEKNLLRFAFKKEDFPEKTNRHDYENNHASTSYSQKIKNFAKNHRWLIFFWMRELLWLVTPWKKSESLKHYVTTFAPDIIFLPIYSFSYINKLACHLSKSYNIPMVGYVSDDEYSYNPYKKSLFYKFNKYYQRKWIKRAIDECHILYTISDLQKKEYEIIFGKKCKVLTKGASFLTKPPYQSHQPIRLTYIGNIGTGRWRSLALLAEAINSINEKKIVITLNIYTGTPYTKEMLTAFDKSGVRAHPHINSNKIKEEVDKSDILIHVESFNAVDMFAVHQSFSTKIVDYVASGKCLLGIGPYSVASIALLKDNDLALTCTNSEDILPCLQIFLNDSSILKQYSDKAWSKGQQLFDIRKIHSELEEDFKHVIACK